MIYKAFSLYYLQLFPPLAAVSLLGWLWKSLLSSLRLHVCQCCWLLTFHSRKRKLAALFPPSVTPLSTMLWSRAVMNPELGTIRLKCITIGIHLILVKAMWPRINQWQSLLVEWKSRNTNWWCIACVFQIWWAPVDYEELAGGLEPIFWMNNK